VIAMASLASLKTFLSAASRLDPDVCLKWNAGLGALAAGAPILVLVLPISGDQSGVPLGWAILQTTIGLTFALASGVAWVRRDVASIVLVGQAMVLMIAVPLYVALMVRLMTDGEPRRVSHLPGVLALGAAYAVRLITDFGAADDSRLATLAPSLTVAAFLLGAVGDAVVVFFMSGLA